MEKIFFHKKKVQIGIQNGFEISAIKTVFLTENLYGCILVNSMVLEEHIPLLSKNTTIIVFTLDFDCLVLRSGKVGSLLA